MNDNISKSRIWDIIKKSLENQGFTPDKISKVRTDLESLVKAQTLETLLEKLPEGKRKELQSSLIKIKTDTEKQKVLQEFIGSAYPEAAMDEYIRQSSVTILSKYVNHLIKKYRNENHKRDLLAQLAAAAS